MEINEAGAKTAIGKNIAKNKLVDK